MAASSSLARLLAPRLSAAAAAATSTAVSRRLLRPAAATAMEAAHHPRRCLGRAARRHLSAAAASAPAPSAAPASAPAAGEGASTTLDRPITTQEVGRLVKVTTNSKMANRDDVKCALAAALDGLGKGNAAAATLARVDQILYRGILPSNMWLVEVGSREAAQRLARQGQLQSPCGNLRVEEVRETDLPRLKLASTLGLDACAVHVQGVPGAMGVDEVAYFFRDFSVLPDGIRLLGAEGQEQEQQHDHRHRGRDRNWRKAFIVKFDTPDEAQRAIREKQAELWGTGKIHIVSYK